MLISHKHKFITIDIPKTGTTSINCSLVPLLGNEDIFSFPTIEQYKLKYVASSISTLHRHARYEDVITRYPECIQYFTFCFFRNPWDRLLSFYFFKKYNAFNKIPQDMTFKYFLLSNSVQHLDQYSYTNGFSDFSFIGHFENLQQDFNIVCDKIGIPHQQLPRKNKTNHKHYSEYYDDETRQIVAEKYARDIEYFGYKFGG